MKLKFNLFITTILLCSSCSPDQLSESSVPNHNTNIYDGPVTVLIKKQLFSNSILSKNSVCENISESQEKTFGDFSRLGTGVHLMWPGNLLQGKTMRSGQLATIPVGDDGRNQIEIKVDAFSSNPSVPTSQYIDNPTAGKVQTALGSILDSYYSSGTNFPANYTIDIQRTFNNTQLQLALNIGYTGLPADLSASFGVNFNSSKTYYAVTLKQKFFSVSVHPKVGLQGSNGWIKENYSSNDLSQYVSAENPSLYISSVTYGRLYALVYESNESATKIEQALNFAYKSPSSPVSVSQKLEYQHTLQNAKVYVKQLGGSATAGLESALGALAGNFDSIRNFVTEGAEASKQNPGYPIEFTAVNTDSNLPVTIKVEDTLNYQNCTDNGYKLIIKNIDFPTLPIVFRTQANYYNSPYYLGPGENIVLPFNINLQRFVYGNSIVEQIDLNNGNGSDDINFYPNNSSITYKGGFFSFQNVIFQNYKNIALTTAYTVEDSGLNGGGPAEIVATKDLANNALIIEIKKK